MKSVYTNIILRVIKDFFIVFLFFLLPLFYFSTYLVINWFFFDFLAVDGSQTERDILSPYPEKDFETSLSSLITFSERTYSQFFAGHIDNFILNSFSDIQLIDIAAFYEGYLYFLLLFSFKEILFFFVFLFSVISFLLLKKHFNFSL